MKVITADEILGGEGEGGGGGTEKGTTGIHWIAYQLDIGRTSAFLLSMFVRFQISDQSLILD